MGLIGSRYTRAAVEAALVDRRAFDPFPGLRERVSPEDADDFRDAARRAATTLPFPALTARAYRAYLATGRDEAYSRPYFSRRTATGELAVGAWLAGDGSHAEDLSDAIWQICEESSWLLPSHNYPPAGGPKRALPDAYDPWVDLFTTETAALLSWSLYLNGGALDRIEPRIGERARAEVLRRVVMPYVDRTDYWWMGYERDPGVVLNNWNPWCTANVLAATLLTVDDPRTRLRVVMRAISVLDMYLEGYRDDGGCDEGTMYWGAAGGALYDALELISLATGGGVVFWDVPRIRAMVRYPVLTHIDADWYVDFADGDARLQLPADLLWSAGRRFGDTEMEGLGRTVFRQGGSVVRPGTYYNLYRLLRGLDCAEAMRAPGPQAACPREAWLPGVQVLVAREKGGSPEGLYLAAKGGHNGESHSHNDVGSFVVYLDGQPLLVDPGTETYTAATFHPAERWKLWTTRSSYHNLPEIGGVEQHNGAAYGARDVACGVEESGVRLAMDIAGAYPAEAGVRRWVREIRLVRGGEARVEVTDRWDLSGAPKELVWCFVTQAEPGPSAKGVVLSARPGSRALLGWDAADLECTVERIALEDPRIRSVWGDSLDRVRLRHRGTPAAGSVTFRIARTR